MVYQTAERCVERYKAVNPTTLPLRQTRDVSAVVARDAVVTGAARGASGGSGTVRVGNGGTDR